MIPSATNLERNSLREFENRSAIERGKRLTVDLELDDHHGARRPAVDLLPRLPIARDFGDLRVLEHGAIEFGGFFGLIVEPQAGADL